MFSAIKIMASAMFTLSMVDALPADAAVGAGAHAARSAGGQSHYPFGHGPGFPFHGFPGRGAPPGHGGGHDCDPPVSP